MSDLQEIGASLGFAPWSETDGDLAVRLDGLISGCSSLTVEDAVIRTNEDVLFVIAHIGYRRQVGDNNHVTVRETVVLLQWPGLSFPHLLIQPRTFGSWLMEKAAGLTGLKELDFPGHEEYDKTYSTFTYMPDAVPRIMDDELLTYLTERAGLRVQTADDRVLVCRSGKLLAGDELASLIDDAQGLVSRLTESTRRLLDEGWQPGEAKAQITQNVSGMLGHALKGRTVTREQADEFAALPPPRGIPDSLKRSHLAVSGCVMALAGIFTALHVAAMMIAVLVLILNGGFHAGSMVGVFICTIMVVPFAIGLHFARRFHRKQLRILRNGELVPATIVSINSTNVTINNRQRFKVELEYEAGGAQRRKSINAYGQSVQLAQSMLQGGEPTQALVDPENPDEIIWVGQLVNWAS